MASQPTEHHDGELVLTEWTAVPTFVVDAAIGNVHVGGLHRITLAEFVLNATPGSETPKVRPVVTIALTPASLQYLAVHFANLVQQYHPEPAQDG